MTRELRLEPLTAREEEPPAAPTRSAELVHVAFEIDLDAALDLPTFEGSSDVRPTQRPSKRGNYLPRSAIDAKLDGYADFVAAGATDAMLAERTGLRPGQVRRWRRRHSVSGKCGARSADVRLRVRAAAPHPSPHVLVTLHKTVSGGTLRAPAYVLRRPLIYDRFATLVRTLVEAGFRSSFISSALGVHERDVDVAHGIARRYLR